MGDKKRILVVDKDPKTRSLAKRILEASEYHVIEADNYSAAVQKLKKKPDVVLVGFEQDVASFFTAMSLPDMQSRIGLVPVILMTDKDRVSAANNMISVFGGSSRLETLAKMYVRNPEGQFATTVLREQLEEELVGVISKALQAKQDHSRGSMRL